MVEVFPESWDGFYFFKNVMLDLSERYETMDICKRNMWYVENSIGKHIPNVSVDLKDFSLQQKSTSG